MKKWGGISEMKSIRASTRVRLARIKRTVKGKFTTWRKGTTVLARRCSNGRYYIERERWREPKVQLVNSCCNVPKTALEFFSAKTWSSLGWK